MKRAEIRANVFCECGHQMDNVSSMVLDGLEVKAKDYCVGKHKVFYGLLEFKGRDGKFKCPYCGNEQVIYTGFLKEDTK